jgi:hypothetical protein
MPFPLSLDEVADQLDSLFDQSTAFVNRESGEIMIVGDDELSLVEEGEEEDEAGLPEWQRSLLPVLREIVESEKWVALPNKFDIHEWEIMRRFADNVDDDDLSDELQRAIHGRGAFRMFRATIENAGVREQWFAFKREALRKIAREALEELGLPYR